MHELGHFCHYSERGGYSGFTGVHKLLKESFASYVGWSIGDDYYSDNGFVKPFAAYEITGQERQGWYKTDNREYTPLFVDLIDDYNQATASALRNQDLIKNFSHSIIRTISAECKDWNSVKAKLQQYVGVYYTSADLNTFMAPYDYWFARN